MLADPLQREAAERSAHRADVTCPERVVVDPRDRRRGTYITCGYGRSLAKSSYPTTDHFDPRPMTPPSSLLTDPEAPADAPSGAGPTHPSRTGGTSWIARLATLDSGVRYIHALLERAARDWDLDDAILVVRERSAGRQVFRLGRRPPSDAWSTVTVVHAPEGLHTRPHLPEGHLGRAAVVALCQAAFRMDVLLHRSLTDPLTGLHDRASFGERAEAWVDRGQRYGQGFCLAVIDLDGFKQINDELGHSVGDTFLREFARALRSVVRGMDVAARVGGDEFALLVSDADPSEAQAVIARIHAALADHGVPIGFSHGIASYPDDGQEVGDLFVTADTRLYEAKASTR